MTSTLHKNLCEQAVENLIDELLLPTTHVYAQDSASRIFRLMKAHHSVETDDSEASRERLRWLQVDTRRWVRVVTDLFDEHCWAQRILDLGGAKAAKLDDPRPAVMQMLFEVADANTETSGADIDDCVRLFMESDSYLAGYLFRRDSDVVIGFFNTASLSSIVQTRSLTHSISECVNSAGKVFA